MPFPKVQIVVLQYNNSEDTIKCLQSLKDLSYQNCGVTVVDNGSQAVDHKKIKDFFSLLDSRFYFLASDTNLGYAGGNNLGIKHALKGKTDYVLILNNDTEVRKDFLTKLVAAGETDRSVGIIAPAIDEGDRTVFGGQIRWLRPELPHTYLKSTTYNLKPETYLSGSCLLIKRGVIEKIGLLDERYFLYFEDADYCQRTQRTGYKLQVAADAVISHKVSSSASSLGPPLLLRYHFRNALLFNSKNGPVWVKILLPLWAFFIIVKQVIKIVSLPSRRVVSKSILNGVVDFWRGRFGKVNA